MRGSGDDISMGGDFLRASRGKAPGSGPRPDPRLETRTGGGDPERGTEPGE